MVHHSFSAQNAEVAEQHLAERYGSLDFGPESFTYAETSYGDEALNIAEIRWTGELFCRAEMARVTVLSQAARYRWEVAGERGVAAGAPVMFQPGEPIVTAGTDSRMRALLFEKRRIGRTPLSRTGLPTKKIIVHGTAFETTDEIADAVMDLAERLAQHGIVERIEFPCVVDGTVTIATVLLGELSTIATVRVPGSSPGDFSAWADVLGSLRLRASELTTA